MSILLRRSVAGVTTVLALAMSAACAGSGGAASSDPDAAWDPVRLAALDEVEGYSDVLAMRDAADLVVVGSFQAFELGRRITIPDGLGGGEDDVLVWVDGKLKIDEILRVADHMAPLEDALADGVLTDDGSVLTVEFFAGGMEASDQINKGIAAMNADLVDHGEADRDYRAVLFLRLNGGPGEPLAAGGPDDLPPGTESANGCVIDVGERIMRALPEGDVFDPARHYPGYDEARHGDCLFRLPDDGAVEPVTPQAATGDVDDIGRLRLTWSYGLITGTGDRPVDAPLGEHFESTAEDGHAAAENPLETWSSMDEFIEYVRSGSR